MQAIANPQAGDGAAVEGRVHPAYPFLVVLLYFNESLARRH
jgi:hypothetical protein